MPSIKNTSPSEREEEQVDDGPEEEEAVECVFIKIVFALAL